MKTELKHYTVEEILKGFVYNELEGKGLFGLDGKLVIQPECGSPEIVEGFLCRFRLGLGFPDLVVDGR